MTDPQEGFQWAESFEEPRFHRFVVIRDGHEDNYLVCVITIYGRCWWPMTKKEFYITAWHRYKNTEHEAEVLAFILADGT